MAAIQQCKRTSHSGFTRRHFMGLSLSGGLASLMAGPLGAFQDRADSRLIRSRACILLWLDGGPSHIDTFDPKPGRYSGGPFKSISTSVPGIRITEHLPRMADRMQHIALIRSLTSREGNHHRAKHLLHTGAGFQRSVIHPSLGSRVAHALYSARSGMEFVTGAIPQYVSIGNVHFGAGVLGSDYDPLRIPNPGQLLVNLNSPYNPAAARALDISEEPLSVRRAYGETRFGAGCLLARRLVEAGAHFVEVSLPGWDTHSDNFTRTEALCRELDPAFAALLDDLQARDLFDNTLLLCTGEFGRKPAINENEGRDHHTRCWSAALAGGGVRGGQVIGATDEEGGKVVDRPVTPADLFQTCCVLLDVNPDAQSYQSQKSPGRRAINGQPVAGIIKTMV